ncbi:hypothetical protein GCM10020254_87120 [Streptomyces goshikiensis]
MYALLAPATAARIRTELDPVLDRPEARTGLLTVAAQNLQAQDRTDFYAELAGPVRGQLPPPLGGLLHTAAVSNGNGGQSFGHDGTPSPGPGAGPVPAAQ